MLFTIIEIVFSVYKDEITELKVLEERVKKLESKESSSSHANASKPRNCWEVFVNVHKIPKRSMMVKVIGIYSHFLFCTIAAPDSLWIKIYLTCVAIYVTLTEKLEEKVILSL
ncbi:2239_t:CDS:2, partial [Dentiscutata erythropus]